MSECDCRERDDDDIPDLAPLIDALRKDSDHAVKRLAKIGHTACPACIEMGFVIAQRAYIRSFVAAHPEVAPDAQGVLSQLTQAFEENIARPAQRPKD